MKRPIESKDIVRTDKGSTGVVNRLCGNNVNVFITQNNPAGIGIWFNIKQLKRIGRVK